MKYFLTFSFFTLSINSLATENPYVLNNVASSLPRKYQERMEFYFRAQPKSDGPNCFQATAFVTGLSNRMTYMSDQEFTWLLKKFRCEKLEKHDSVKSGDIGLLSSDFSQKNGMKNYEHAFIWDRFPDYLVEKIGSYSSFKLKQTHIRESEQWTMFKKECLSDPDKCPLKLTNYRCPEYLAEKAYEGSNYLSQQSKTVEGWLQSAYSPNKNELEQLMSELQKVIIHHTEEIKKESNRNLLESYSLEKEEALSLIQQLQIIKDPN
jgi:hypothetical protein